MSSNKKNNNNNKKGEEEKAHKSETQIIFENLSSFYDKYISNGKLIVKSATLLDIERISYIKGKDLKQFFNENFEEIQKEILSITKANIGKEANKESLQSFYSINRKYNIMHVLTKMPGDKAKYPKRLFPLKKSDDIKLDLVFNETGFYYFNIKKEKSNKPIFYLALLIIFILLVVLFPLWPLKVKLGVLYFLLVLMIALTVFLILIIVIAIVGTLFGYDIIIIPNIDNPKLCWKDRFLNPFVEVSVREDPCWMIILRIILIISLIGLGVLGYYHPAIPKKCYSAIKNLTIKIFSYGKQKIEDIHYRRNDISVDDGYQYLDDLGNL